MQKFTEVITKIHFSYDNNTKTDSRLFTTERLMNNRKVNRITVSSIATDLREAKTIFNYLQILAEHLSNIISFSLRIFL